MLESLCDYINLTSWACGHNVDVGCLPRVFMKISRKSWWVFCLAVVAALWLSPIRAFLTPQTPIKDGAAPGINEGPVIACEVTVGPFDIHRKYRSMEGPWTVAKFKIGELIASGTATVPENHIHYVENENGSAPSMNGRSGGKHNTPPYGEELSDLKGAMNDKRELYWLKGLKVEVLDENGNTLPTAEFICHTNLDFSFVDHNMLFTDGERWNNDRLITITQGQTKVLYPPGFAVPLASDEPFRVTFQAANRTSNARRRLKHKATFYFIKDSDLVYPLTALYGRVPFAQVIVDKNLEGAKKEDLKRHPSCDLQAFAVNAPNNVTGGVSPDAAGRVLSGHWVVPPGVHTYKSNVNDLDSAFSQTDRKMRFAWTHIHPCCTEVSVTRCDGNKKQKMFTTHVKTKTEPGLELVDIELIKPKEAIVFPKDGHYELEGTYNNTLPIALDSMISVGMFFEDTNFRRPTWSLPDSKAAYCGVICAKNAEASPAIPLFDKAKDGPLLKGDQAVVLNTNRGKIKLTLDANVAPCSVTHLHQIIKCGGFNGTRFAAYSPGFLLQLAAAEDKGKGQRPMSPKLKKQLRRLPLEATKHHRKYAISVARQENDENSGTSSICLMLAESPHLDRRYSVIGHLSEDAQTIKALDAICKDFESAVIVSAAAVGK
jgi:cyclophilin family peptidyl-prolyl cis-trans isomerase